MALRRHRPILRGLDADGQWGAGPSIPIAGAHLSYFAGANRIPGSSAVLPLADVLTLHWATGRLATLDRRLGVALAWIQRPDDIAAAEAELSDGPVPDATWNSRSTSFPCAPTNATRAQIVNSR